MKNTRLTKQKKILETKLNEMNKIFTADDLLFESKKEDSKIGIATVYRFLKDTVKNKHLHSYVCDRKKVYSSKTDNHCHFECEKCGKIEHFSINDLDSFKDKINGDICHFQINVSGVCNKCKK